MPLPIKVNGTGGQVAYFVLNHTTKNQNFAEQIDFPVSSVQFNYENQILQRNSTVAKDTTILAVNDSGKDPVKVYPNPVKNYISVSGITKDQQYEIYSMDGKLIKTGTYSSGKTIDVNILTKGVYLLKIENQNLKFIKE